MHPAQVAVIHWLNEVVIGLHLCPFSAKPTRENRVRFFVSEAKDEEGVLEDMQREMELLDAHPATEIETTLVIVPNSLQDFFAYTQFLQWTNQLLKRMNWQGVYQIASFHPDYCFASAEPDDPENLTNRAPYPILHIIREASLAKALEFFPDVEAIPDRNRERVASLSDAERRKLFPYLFDRK